MTTTIKIKRAYETPLPGDGYRVLADRLWPRGVKKEDAGIDEWAKELAPSTALRKWFNHDPERWHEFQMKYRQELKENEAVPEFMEKNKDRKTITIVYGAKDTEHTHALVLQKYLQQHF